MAKSLTLSTLVLAACLALAAAQGSPGTATFYGGADGSGTKGKLGDLHYYRIGLCSRSFIPVTFGPGTKGGFCPGSIG